MMDKIGMVAGANSAIGKVTALELARLGAAPVMRDRRRQRTRWCGTAPVGAGEAQTVEAMRRDETPGRAEPLQLLATRVTAWEDYDRCAALGVGAFVDGARRRALVASREDELQPRIPEDARLALRTLDKRGADSPEGRQQVDRLAAHVSEHREVLRT